MTATPPRPFVKKPALLCGDLVRFDDHTTLAGQYGRIEALALAGGTVADVRLDNGELIFDVSGQDITRVDD